MEDSNEEMLAMEANQGNFGFAFNDRDFSDRVLRIEIKPKDSLSYQNVEVKTVHISSPIVAAKSPFFFRLFKNGMSESRKKSECLCPEKHVTLRINASEEVALADLLNFMYRNSLSAATSLELLDVLMVADKFQVTSCMKYCIEMLLKLPMSLESVLPYLELPSCVLEGEVVQPLIDAAKQYLVARFKGFAESEDEVMKLPLSALEVVLGSDSLQVNSEDVVFDFIVKWARAHYPKPEERREILTKRLAQFIRFPYMSCSELSKVAVCSEFDREEASEIVIKALCSKVEDPYGQHNHASKDLSPTKCSFSGRSYTKRLINVVKLELPWPCCFVYFDLSKDECANLFPLKDLNSQTFHLGGRSFYLNADCGEHQQTLPLHFGLYVFMTEGSESCPLSIEFSAMNKSSKVFESHVKKNNLTLTDKEGWGSPNLLGISWTDLMSDDCEYFINGILHLRADLIINSSEVSTLVFNAF